MRGCLRLPSVVFEIVAGIVIGPSVFGWVEVDATIEVLALIGLAFLLFLAGLEIDFGQLRGVCCAWPRWAGSCRSRSPRWSASMSVDGYIDDDAGLPALQFVDDEFERHIDEMLESIDGMVFGRVAYEQLASYWPNAGSEASPVQVRKMHELPKYVLSRTLDETEWHNSHVLGDDPATAITNLKQQDGRDLALFAGASAATSALELGVVDELRIVVNPALVAGNTRLFDGQYPRTELRLTETSRFSSGALFLRYELAAA